MKSDAKLHAYFWQKFFLQNPQNWKKRIWIFSTISLDAEKIQKRTIPHLKAENLIITVYFMHFLQKITMRVAMDKNVCIIFFVTVSNHSFWSFFDNSLCFNLFSPLKFIKLLTLSIAHFQSFFYKVTEIEARLINSFFYAVEPSDWKCSYQPYKYQSG